MKITPSLCDYTVTADLRVQAPQSTHDEQSAQLQSRGDGKLTEFSEEVICDLNSDAKSRCGEEELRRGEEFKNKIQCGQEASPSQAATES